MQPGRLLLPARILPLRSPDGDGMRRYLLARSAGDLDAERTGRPSLHTAGKPHRCLHSCGGTGIRSLADARPIDPRRIPLKEASATDVTPP